MATPPMPTDISRVLDEALTRRPDAVAVQARSGSLTYRDLDAAASHAAGGLWECGVRPGDRLAASLPNDLAVVVAFHAAMRIGALWVGINTALAGPEKAELLRHCAPKMALTTSAIASQLRSDPGRGPQRPQTLVVDTGVADDEWDAMLAARHSVPDVTIDPGAPAGIAYTSGTTGAPKGVVHSQHNLLMPGAVLVAERHYGPELRKGDCLPLTILNMMALTTLLTAQAGGCCVVMDRRDAEGIADWIREARITVWNGVPTQLWDMLRHKQVSREDLQTLAEVWCGGGDCPDELRDEFADAFGHDLRATYGLTEAPTIVAMDPVGSRWEKESSGRPLPHLSVRVLDEESNPQDAGDTGELCLSAATSGPWAGQWNPMLGYWEGDGVQALPAGPLRTGDLGTLDAQGWLRVVDRRKLLILRGGANVYPAEVERALLQCPGVNGAAVFGITDDRLGERVAALIEPDHDAEGPTAARLAEHCAVLLARYKRPEVWGFVEVLPRNAMGKVVRSALPGLLAAVGRSEPGTRV